MKKLILLLLFLFSLGAQSQEVSLLQFEDDTDLDETHVENKTSPQPEYLKSIDGLSGRKLAKYIREKGVTEKLIRKGDEYFDKMWYAEAAKIYDIVLEKSEAKHTLKLLSRAGDSHYYSGNLEKSFKWYNELYQTYSDEISEDTFFKYTQTLKGTGKYRRAAALTKLFRQKRNEPIEEFKNIRPIIWKGATSVKIKNLAINSRYSDFSPMFHKDSEVLPLTSRIVHA